MIKNKQDALTYQFDRICLTDTSTYQQICHVTDEIRKDIAKVLRFLRKGYDSAETPYFVIKDQQRSDGWMEERKIRLTGSNFRNYIHATMNTRLKLAAEELSGETKFFTNAAMQYGTNNEHKARQQYEKLHPGWRIEQSSLTIMTDQPWIGASPDGLIYDDKNLLIGAIEIKCPYSKKNMTVHEAIKNSSPGSFYLYYDHGNTMRLHQNHQYYYQIQGQMMVLGIKWIDLVVRTEKDLAVCRIQRNELFIRDLSEKLRSLYFQHYIWEVMKKFVRPDYLKKDKIYYMKSEQAALLF